MVGQEVRVEVGERTNRDSVDVLVLVAVGGVPVTEGVGELNIAVKVLKGPTRVKVAVGPGVDVLVAGGEVLMGGDVFVGSGVEVGRGVRVATSGSTTTNTEAEN